LIGVSSQRGFARESLGEPPTSKLVATRSQHVLYCLSVSVLIKISTTREPRERGLKIQNYLKIIICAAAVKLQIYLTTLTPKSLPSNWTILK
jgi:hypothetical protein